MLAQFKRVDSKKQVNSVENENAANGVSIEIHPMSEFNAFVCVMYQHVKGNGIIKFLDDCLICGNFVSDDPWFMWDEDNYEIDSGKSPFDFIIDKDRLVDMLIDTKGVLEEIGFSHGESEELRKKM